MTQLHEVCLDLAGQFAIVQPENVMASSVWMRTLHLC